MDETRTVANLPNLDVEILHRRDEDTEQLLISLRAQPPFETFARRFETTGPHVWLAPNPFLAWQQAALAFWGPWLAAALRALPGAMRGTPENDQQP